MTLAELLRCQRTIRAIGFDDAPFMRGTQVSVPIAGVVCAGTRFEGMVWGQIQPDGWDATDTVIRLLAGSKFLAQVHIVLFDGISMGGFNVIDLPQIAAQLQRPCVAVMRHYPNLAKIEYALQRLPDADRRLSTIHKAGVIHAAPPFYFQVCGAAPDVTAAVLRRLTDRGHVPEALRIAHLITSAVIKGVSGKQA